MSKLSFYDASFPFSFGEVIDKIEKKSLQSDKQFIKKIKKRINFSEFLFTSIKSIQEDYIDINGNITTIERLDKKEISFRIYDRKSNNFIIINQPRSFLELKNFLSKLFNFEFYITQKSIDLNNFLKLQSNKIESISKIDIREIHYPDHVFSKTVFYTQNSNANLIDAINLYLKSNYFKIFKVDFYIQEFPSSKLILSHDCKISFTNLEIDEIINFLHDSFSLE